MMRGRRAMPAASSAAWISATEMRSLSWAMKEEPSPQPHMYTRAQSYGPRSSLIVSLERAATLDLAAIADCLEDKNLLNSSMKIRLRILERVRTSKPAS